MEILQDGIPKKKIDSKCHEYGSLSLHLWHKVQFLSFKQTLQINKHLLSVF